MPTLHIDLQEGFDHETVVIQVNGREVFQKPDVTTKLQVGLAERVELDVAEGSADVDVQLPFHEISESLNLTVSDPPRQHLGVSLTPEGQISFRVSDQHFKYL